MTMTAPFKDHFSGVAQGYHAFRPRYPSALFEWLASVSPRRDRAIDLGCGTGQATVALADHFGEVVGLDPSAEQVAQAAPHERVRYAVAPAEATGLPDACADLLVAAQALHWFDQPRLHAELTRVARRPAVFAAFTYDLCRVNPSVDAVVDRLYRRILGPFWPPERAHVDAGYRTLPFPWPELTPPDLAIEERWDLERFVGYLRTWSAVGAYVKAVGTDPIALVGRELTTAWGTQKATHGINWKLTVRAGRI
jgi:SAM-dependent methyltransferase